MALSEFKLIDRYFTRSVQHKETALGIGDDCALLEIESGMQLALTVDTLVENIHFFADVAPETLGYKALAVSLSDLAAIGAEPRYATLALTLPDVDEDWLQGFSEGFFEIADQYHVDLIGGDTTRGPLSITVQAQGLVPQGQAILRSGAQVGDLIYVTGYIGDAGLALKMCLDESQCNDAKLMKRLNKPDPRVNAGLALRNLAHACIDVSDGLAADLSHILQASQVGAVIDLAKLPLSDAVRNYQRTNELPCFAMTSGDDYELCFTLPAERVKRLEALSNDWSHQCRCIGRIDDSGSLKVLDDGQQIEITGNSYQHFS